MGTMNKLVRSQGRIYFTEDAVKGDEQLIENPTLNDFLDWCEQTGQKESSGGVLLEFKNKSLEYPNHLKTEQSDQLMEDMQKG